MKGEKIKLKIKFIMESQVELIFFEHMFIIYSNLYLVPKMYTYDKYEYLFIYL